MRHQLKMKKIFIPKTFIVNKNRNLSLKIFKYFFPHLLLPIDNEFKI